jgi:uncharacterized protein YigA (DUF484 family)
MTAPLDSAAVAQFLLAHPAFFAEHASLLDQVKLSSPLTGKTVSLQERQMEVMRDTYKALELRMDELSRTAEHNAAIADKFHGWTQALFKAPAADLPRALVDALIDQFALPQATLRLWDLAPAHAGAWFGADVSADVRRFGGGLLAPYCGSNHDFEAVRWLADAATVRSTALLPLRDAGGAFGLLVLGSPDPQRFHAELATDYLRHIADTASAALAALRH